MGYRLAGNKPKVMVVYGTRPEAIKLAPVILEFQQDPRFDSVVVSTGQHVQMLQHLNESFDIRPAYDLGLMRRGQSLNSLFSNAVSGLDPIIESERPDVIMSQGDTTTALAAAVAGFHRGIKVAHLEAGLRTGDLASPFPEEGNRLLIDRVSNLMLAPTEKAKSNLLNENADPDRIVVTGNTVIDTLLKVSESPVIFDDRRLQALVESQAKIVLVTSHRRENLSKMREIGSAIMELAEVFVDCAFVLPLHANPAVREAMAPLIGSVDNILVTDPLPYRQFTQLLKHCYIVMTDSGGIQEEAPAFGKPVLVLRESTERSEAIDAGVARIAGTEKDSIVGSVSSLLCSTSEYAAMANSVSPFGDGKASIRSVAAIANLTGVGQRLPDFMFRP